MSTATVCRWQTKQTEESRMVEDTLRQAGFAMVDAYRHNPASIRVRIIDDRFRGMSLEDRDRMVEPFLDAFPISIQQDIINLLLMYPGEDKASFRVSLFNAEFENGESGL